MTAFYMGVKKVTAWPQEKDGKAGYAVKYEDGYISWSPAEVFERSYFRLHDPEGNSLTEFDINRFLGSIEGVTMGEKTTIVQATLINGYEMVESSSCVDPKNYDEQLGVKLCAGKVRDKIWGLLGFVLQWAHSGIKVEPGVEE